MRRWLYAIIKAIAYATLAENCGPITERMSVKTIQAEVAKQNLKIDFSNALVVAGSTNIYKLKIAYDEEWDDIESKIIAFVNGDTAVSVTDDNSEEGVTIPSDVIFPGQIAIGVIGVQDGETKITTAGIYGDNVLMVAPESEGLSKATENLLPADPTDSLWNAYQEIIGDAFTKQSTNLANLNEAIESATNLNAILEAI